MPFDEDFPVEDMEVQNENVDENQVDSSENLDSGQVAGSEDMAEGEMGSSEEQIQNPAPVETPQDVAQPEAAPEVDDAEFLRQKVVELSDKLAQIQNAPQAVEKPVENLPKMEAPAAGDVSNVNFLEGLSRDDYIDILDDPAKFNALMNKVATVAFTAAVNAAQERVMRQIPAIVNTSAQQQATIQATTQKFYQANPDLVNYKAAVAMAAQQIFNEEPNLSLADMLQKAGERTRQTLRLRQSSQRQRVPAQPAGNRVSGSGVDRTVGKPQMSDQERQILELLSI